MNVIVAGKQPALDYLSMDEAVAHCTRGIGIWEWASNDAGRPDVVLACAGDVPTLETVAAAAILRKAAPGAARPRGQCRRPDALLEPDSEHPHGMSDREFDALFTTSKPVIFAYHGYPPAHPSPHLQARQSRQHPRARLQEEGTTTTPFDMVMLNDLDRYHLAIDVIDRIPGLAEPAAHMRQELVDTRLRCRVYTREHGDDAPEVRDWHGPSSTPDLMSS